LLGAALLGAASVFASAFDFAFVFAFARRVDFFFSSPAGSSAAAAAGPSTSCISAMGAESPGRGSMRRMRV